MRWEDTFHTNVLILYQAGWKTNTNTTTTWNLSGDKKNWQLTAIFDFGVKQRCRSYAWNYAEMIETYHDTRI